MELPERRRGEEVANSVSHGLGLLAAAVGLVVMVSAAAAHGGAGRVAAVTVFAVALVLAYLTSTLYHAVPVPRWKAVLRQLDHAAIYLLIAGTYTPIAVAVIGGRRGLALLVTVWTLAAVGIVSELGGRRRWLSITLYLTMGWLVVTVAGPVVATLDGRALALVFAGGLSYTVGVPFYLSRSLPFGHLVWHLLVIVGSALHYVAILTAVALA